MNRLSEEYTDTIMRLSYSTSDVLSRISDLCNHMMQSEDLESQIHIAVQIGHMLQDDYVPQSQKLFGAFEELRNSLIRDRRALEEYNNMSMRSYKNVKPVKKSKKNKKLINVENMF